MRTSLLQGITKDWDHGDFDLVRKSALSLPQEHLSRDFCIFEYEIVIGQGAITDIDSFGLGFVIDFSVQCEVGFIVRAVADGLKFKSVHPPFPMGLRSTRYGQPKPKAVPCPLKEKDVLIAVGDSVITDGDNESSVLKKIMYEKFKLSRTEPSNQGCVKCRFGRILTYQDALDQFEVVVTLPIALIGVTPQDLLELTDITSLRQQVSPMSTPDRKKALKLSDTFGYKSPHRLASPTSTPDRQKGISMDLRDRLNPSARGGPLNESSFAGKANLDMRSRLAATASDNLDDKVSPNRSVHTVSAKSRMEASPVSNIPPKTKSDLVEGITELPVKPPAQMEVPSKARADLAAAAAAIKSSKSAEDGVKIANPFFIPSPSRDAAERAAAAPKRSSPSRSAASITAAENKAARAHATAETVKVADASSSFGNLKFILIGTMVFILFFLAKFLFGGGNSVIKPAFTEKPVGIYRTERIFADAVKNYKGILRPDIVIVD